ncbi:MAG: tetratricopeptide repeat protein [Thermoguttaceae bacterium]
MRLQLVRQRTRWLALLAAIVFGQTLGHDFIDWDDSQYVVNNPHVTRGLSAQGIAWAFTQRYQSNWHPLTWISHMLDCQMYGLWAGGHHLTNLLLHAATAILLFLALRRMTGRLGCSALVAMVFAVHPLRVESVAWVAERKDVLSGFFFMLTLWAYGGYARSAFSWWRYALVVVCFALGLTSKPMLVTLPFILLLLDYWPLRRVLGSRLGISRLVENLSCSSESTDEVWAMMRLRRLIVEKLPLLALAAASCTVTLWAQTEAMEDLEVRPLGDRAANALVSYGQYILATFWPANLAVYYPHPPHGWPALPVAVSGMALFGISAVAIWARRRFPYLFSGWFWYVGMLVPVIGLIQVGGQAMADRYTYLPQIGLLLALVWGADDVWRWCRLGPRLEGVAAALVVLTLVVCATRQVSFWRDAETLWRQTIACTTENAPAHANLASILGRRRTFPEAIDQFKIAFQIDPNQPGFLNNYSITLREAKQIDEAIEFGRLAVQQKPEDPTFHGNLALALTDKGLWDEAIAEYRKALELQPDDYRSRFQLGRIYARLGRQKEAADEYRAMLAAEQDFPQIRFYLANALAGSNAFDAAVEQYRKALDRLPGSGEIWHNLGVILQRCGKAREAVEPLQRAVELMPGNAEFRHDLAVVLREQGKASEAIEQLQQAVALAPFNAVYQRELAVALIATGRGSEAIAHYRAALNVSAGDVEAQRGLGEALLAEGKTDEAAEVFRKLLVVKPDDAEAHSKLGDVLFISGRVRDAVVQWREELRLSPNNEKLMNDLAWILATLPDDSLRNGKEAVQLAQQAVKLSGGKQPSLLDTLAAAYAEAGRFQDAVRTAREALQQATEQGNQRLAESLRKRLKFYEEGKPWRDAPPTGPAKAR